MCLCLRDWLVTFICTVRFYVAIFSKQQDLQYFGSEGLSDVDKESFLLQTFHSLLLENQRSVCRIIHSQQSSNVNQAAVFERQQLYMLLLSRYTMAFRRNNSGNQGDSAAATHCAAVNSVVSVGVLHHSS